MRKSKIPTFAGLIVLIVGLVIGVFIVQNQQIFQSGASGEAAPKDIRITNVSDSSFTVSWVTQKETSGFLKWGENSTLGRTQNETSSEKSLTHSVVLDSLKPQARYYFKINSDGEDFDNSGSVWSTETGPKISGSPSTTILSGSLVDGVGKPVKNALVYLTISGAQSLSTQTSGSGAWLIPVAGIRTENLGGIFVVSDTTEVSIFTNSGPFGVSTAQSVVKNTKPAPAMVLGKVHDFRNIENTGDNGISEASINLPDSGTPTSGFDTNPATSELSPSTTVTLESISQGEVITTTDPEFFGEGPKGTAITITVESEVVTENLIIKNDGTWSWSPPTNLEPGTHKITVSWKDVSGITRTLVRNFVVSAAEGPAFESTPSASLIPSASPSSTPKPSIVASALPSIIASVSPLATVSATPNPVLDSGSLTPTIVLSIMGIGTILLGLFIWKKAT